MTWAKANNIHYDFIAISYYPHITKPHELDMNEVYKHDIAPIQQHPDWNANASLEIHEFRLISKMLRAGFVSVSTPHASSFFAMLSKMILENNIKEIFQWGTGRNGSYIPELLTQNALYPMVGNHLFTNHVSGQPAILGNRIDGIFTQQANQSAYDILLFNFNATNNDYQASEKTQLSLTINAPAGTAFRYRIGNIDSNNNSTQMFLNDYPKANQLMANGGWRKPNVHNTASISTALNDVGNQVYLKNQNKYKISKEKMILWGEWQQGYTTGNDKKTSEITLISELPSFAVQKLEINVLP